MEGIKYPEKRGTKVLDQTSGGGNIWGISNAEFIVTLLGKTIHRLEKLMVYNLLFK